MLGSERCPTNLSLSVDQPVATSMQIRFIFRIFTIFTITITIFIITIFTITITIFTITIFTMTILTTGRDHQMWHGFHKRCGPSGVLINNQTNMRTCTRWTLCFCHIQVVGCNPRYRELVNIYQGWDFWTKWSHRARYLIEHFNLRREGARQSRTSSTSTHSNFSEKMITTCFVKPPHAIIFILKYTINVV